MGGPPLPAPSKKSTGTNGIFTSAGARPKLPASTTKKRARCWRQSTSQPRLCSLSMLLVSLFIFGSVPPAPPIGLLTTKKRARCWRQSTSQPRLCSLSMLLVSLFIFGSVPPAPPIGLLTLHIPVENDPNVIHKTTLSNFSFTLIKSLPVVITPASTLAIDNNNSSLTKKSSNSSSCFHKQAIEKDCDMSYLATFPGSGSELCLELIEGLTGIKTGHAYPFVKNNTSQKVVTMKTHYPNKILRGGNPKHSPVPVTRAILLLRNPMNALPSFFNFLFEQKSHQQHHYFQAPIEEWIAWRDDDFASKLFLWRFHMDYWLSQHHLLSSSSSSSSNNNNSKDHKKGNNKTMILIGFENLVHKVKGPLVLQELSYYLQQHNHVTSITTPSQVACAWDHIVVRRSANKRGDRGKRRRKTIDRYVPPYRNEQLQDMVDMLQLQRDRYRDQYPQLVVLLNEYLETAQSRLQSQGNTTLATAATTPR